MPSVKGSPTNSRAWRLALSGLIGFALLSGACTRSGAASEGGATQIHQVVSITSLRDAFNADVGTTRLILIVSPT